MSNKKCCVPGCVNSEVVNECSLHKFPNPSHNKDLFNTWVYAVGGDILQMNNENIFKYRRVCRLHFEERYLCRNNRLSNIATPTKNMPGLSSSKFISRAPERKALTCIQPPKLSAANEPVAGPSSQKYVVAVQQHALDVEMKENIEPVAGPSNQKSAEAVKQHAQDVEMKEDIGVAEKGSRKKRGSTKKGTLKKKTNCVSLSPAENTVYKKLVAVNLKLSKYRNQLKRQRAELKAAKNLTSNKAFLEVIENFTSAAKILTLMHFRESKKSAKGRRFTEDEKIIALSILKTSPKAYKFYRKLYKTYPSKQTLKKLINSCDIKAGINENIFKMLEQKASKIKNESDKICILLFDEMSISPNISYNERKDRVYGFVNNGKNVTPEFADHAQVFMLRGLVRNYKQPVAYTFASAATKGPELAAQIKEVIENVQNAGFRVVATVCDQGTNNTQAIKLLVDETKADLLRKGIEPRYNTIFIGEQEIVPLYDPPHMLKCIRNNFLEKNIRYVEDNESKLAKWEHLEILQKQPSYKGLKLIPKLTESHVIKSKIPKMKVKFASQIFSRTVGRNMGFLAVKGVIPEEAKDTADLLLFFDDLFDSLNGSHSNQKRYSKPLLGPVTPFSRHHETWKKAKEFLKQMKFVDKNGKGTTIPTLKNWIWTLENLELLLKNMAEKYDVTSIWARHLNQDPIENFFGSIRSHGCRNNNPNAAIFASAFVSLLINNLSSFHNPTSNCEKDLCTQLCKLIIKKDDCEATSSAAEIYHSEDVNILVEVQKNDPQRMATIHYVSGYFVKKAKTKIFRNCKKCSVALFSKEEDEFIKYREYEDGKRWLVSASNEFINCFIEIQEIIANIMKKNVTKSNIREFIKTIILIHVNFDFVDCDLHKEILIEKLLNMIITFFLHKFCKKINNILKGVESADPNEPMEDRAKKYSNKFLKRKYN